MLDGSLSYKDDRPILVAENTEESKNDDSGSLFSKASNLFSSASSLYSGRFGNKS